MNNLSSKNRKYIRMMFLFLLGAILFFHIGLGYKNVMAIPEEYLQKPEKGIMGSLGDRITEKGAEIAANIMDEAFEGLTNNASYVAEGLLSYANIVEFTEWASPSTKLFNSLLGKIKGPLVDATRVLAAVITILLFVIYLFVYMTSPDKVKISPLKMILRLVLVSAFIITGNATIDYLIAEVFLPIYEKMNSTFVTPENMNLLGLTTKALDSSGGWFSLVTDSFFNVSPYGFIPFLVSLVMLWALLKELLKLFVELVERYIVFHILLTLSPIAAASFTTDSTENIGKSYIQMLFSQFFLVVMSRFYVIATFYLLFDHYTNAMKSSFTTYIVAWISVLAILKAFQKIDYYLRAMGIGVAQAGGQLADSIQSSFRNVGRAVGGALSRGDRARQAIGGATQAIGAQIGNQTMFNAGAVMGASAAGMARGNVPTKSALNKKFAETQGVLGRSVSMDGGNAAKLLNGYMQDFRARGAAAALDNNSLREGVRSMTGLDVTSASLGKYGDISFDWKDADGNMHSGTLSNISSDMAMPIHDMATGADHYLTENSQASNLQGYDSGELFTGEAKDLMEQLGDTAIASGSDIFETSSLDSSPQIGDVFGTEPETGESIPAKGLDGRVIASNAENIDFALAQDGSNYYGNEASGEYAAASIFNKKTGASELYQNSGYTGYDDETGEHSLTSDGVSNIASKFNEAFPDYHVDPNTANMTYDPKTHTAFFQVKENNSENYVTAYARDIVNPGSLRSLSNSGDIAQLAGRTRMKIDRSNREHKTGIEFGVTSVKKKTNKK